MLRLSEVRLPLEHLPEALTAAVLQRLKLAPTDLLGLHIHKRMARCKDDPHLKPAPDMAYKFVAQAPANQQLRPVVVGFGPAGIFAALILAQSGFKPLVLERGKPVRRTHKRHLGPMAKAHLACGI